VAPWIRTGRCGRSRLSLNRTGMVWTCAS
jgi:hypothetical protein